MNTQKAINKAVLVIHVILIVYCMLTCVHTIVRGSGSGAQRAPAIIGLAALCATLYYLFNGYRKSAAKSFKIMMFLCAAEALFCLLPFTYNIAALTNHPAAAAVRSMAYALCFGLYLMLTFVPDLGKTKSMSILAFIFCANLVILIFTIRNHPGAFSGGSETMADAMRIMRHSTSVVLAMNAAMCNYFKYEDKAQRKSK